ncbi:MAG TPA: ATP-binding cassette domain-containing protein [Spirochaetota bacterium]|nr:ATP-binding cassette domain-containing protein [Spirochaetota bacterium]HOM38358.1 ATP-binding cassette domain-containing protein [Spirochaetota bacterium]HPQ48424.1 ATP-binding cassette domain-containing protein [Spirochaetota bacterium]
MIKIENLYTILEDNIIHKNISLTVDKGKTTVIIGRSGCGKSVLLKVILMLIKPASGKIFFENQDLTKLNEEEIKNIRLKMGVVFQGSALFDSLTVYENVAFGLLKIKKIPEKKALEIARELLEWVGLKNIEYKYPGQLSGGMRKRVGIARALSMNPDIIIFDEPTTGLDPVMTDVIDNLVNRLKTEKKITSLVVTHDMKSAYKIGDYIYMMEKGEIVGEGTIEEIKNSSNPMIKQFIEGKAEGPIKI